MNANRDTKSKLMGIAAIALLVLAVAGLATRKVESSYWGPSSTAVVPATFPSPTEASTALASAAKTGDQGALSKILGPDTLSLLMSDDTESNKAAMDSFTSKFQQMNRWVEMTDGTRVLYIGADNFAFPVPLAKNSSGQWYFDAVAGAEEVRAREIGRNELLAMDACYALADAEKMFYDSSASPQYAQRIVSTPGQQDGLYWPTDGAQTSSPLGDLSQFPKSSLASYSADEPLTIDGYTLRILTAQGADAEGGAQNYIVDGKMTRGFAILAVPVKYGETGIMTFMIGREGIVYEQDLGPDTLKSAASIQQYNPDENWSPVECRSHNSKAGNTKEMVSRSDVSRSNSRLVWGTWAHSRHHLLGRGRPAAPLVDSMSQPRAALEGTTDDFSTNRFGGEVRSQISC